MKSRKKSGAGGLRRRAGAGLVATLLALPLLYLVIRTAAAGMNPYAAGLLPPVDEVPMLRLRIYETLLPNRPVLPELRAVALRAALNAPLAYEPFFIEARAAEQSGNLARAVALMEEARRRRPNFLPTRLQLLTYYARQHRYDAVVGEMDVVLRLSGEARPLVLPELVKLIAEPGGRSALTRLLSTAPDWRRDFFAVAMDRPVRPDDALALLQEMEARQPRGNHAEGRRLYLQALFNAGQVTRARSLWLQTLPAELRARNMLLFNGDFRPVRAEPPFGWVLRDLDAGRATIEPVAAARPHLSVDYFGGRNVVLAEQFLALAPGRYRLAYLAKSETGVRSGNLYWRLSCVQGGTELGRSPIAGLTGAYRRIESGFGVPASGCPGQRLELHAEAGDVAVPVNLQIAAMELAR